MKKKIVSILIVTILSLNTLLCSAVNISFEDLDNTNFITENDSFEDNNTPFEVTLNIYEDKNDITQSINLLSTNNLDIPQPDISDNVLNSLNYTTVDLTDLATGEVVTHDCNLYLVSNFDEDTHWQECSVCGKVINFASHNYMDNGWTGGSANNCNESNVHQFICECGVNYSTTEGRKAHNWSSKRNHSNEYYYYQGCDCGATNLIHKCIKSDGSRISCANPGRCSLCGCNYTAYHRSSVITREECKFGNVYCQICSKYLGNITLHNFVNNYDGFVTYNVSMTPPSGYSSLSLSYYSWDSDVSITHSKNGLLQTLKIKYNKHKEILSQICQDYDFYHNNEHCFVRFFIMSKPEYIPPTIISIQTDKLENWSTDSTINISGTENYCNSVYITLKDTEGKFYLENIATPVNNGNWNYILSPNIEVKNNTEFILTVRDTLNNITEQSFYLTKIDNKPPMNIGKKETSTEWSKTKDYIAMTTDNGIGQVSISVNDTNNYELAIEEDNIFYKGYTFTGDVYGSILVPVHSKDGLENTSTQYIRIYNLDNTLPTIEEVNLEKSLYNTTITIQANDINTKLNAEGSGITGYAITNENIEPTDYQESNTFTITESNIYYIWVKDLVGNVTSKEMKIPVQYKVTISPDGGTWKGSTEPQEVIISSDEKYDLTPQPTKEGYTFTEWKVTGEGYVTEDGELVITGSDVEVIPIWETNQYSVTYVDYDVTNNKSLNETTKQIDYDIIIRGFDLGNDTSDNAYYNQYRLVSDTESKVTTSSNIVYRYFEFCYTEKSSHLDFNDNDNIDNLRPEIYKLQLQLEDGTLVDEVTLPSDVTDYTFDKLPKYDENGTEYKYTITPIISDRYKVTPNPETDEPEITYISPEYSILIPKLTTLNGKTGDLSYILKVKSTLFYDDKIIVTPDDSFTLTNGISVLIANILQSQTIFTKEDITNNQLIITGDIQVNKHYFAGTWIGVFNFNIKYITEN